MPQYFTDFIEHEFTPLRSEVSEIRTDLNTFKAATMNRFDLLESRMEQGFKDMQTQFTHLDAKIGEVVGMIASFGGRTKVLEDENSVGTYRQRSMELKLERHEHDIERLKTHLSLS